MRVLRGTTILIIVSLFILGGPDVRAGDDEPTERQLMERADGHLGEAAAAIVEAMKKRIEAGDLDAVEELMALLRGIMELRATLGIPTEPEGPPAVAGDDGWGEPPAVIARTDEMRLWFGGRGGRRNLRSNGGSAQTAAAVDLALAWLAKHQDRTGAWNSENVHDVCGNAACQGPGRGMYLTGTTALALLSFLAEGMTPYQGNYRATVAKGLSALLAMQDPEGCIGPRTTQHFTYCHALGAQALAEAYALSQAPRLNEPAQRAMDFIHKAQNPYLAWRYGVRPGDNDTSVTATMISALMAGKKAGLRVGPEALNGALNWLEKVTEPEYGRVGYTARGTGPARPQNVMDKFPADKSESLTAAGMLTRIYCGEDPRKSEMIQKGAHLCLKVLPLWDENAGTIDFYYWYYGTQALFQVGGEPWKVWNKAMKTALVDSQVRTGCERGSWAPVGVWCQDGGRIYSTSMSTLCLQNYYRHGRLVFEKGGFMRKIK